MKNYVKIDFAYDSLDDAKSAIVGIQTEHYYLKDYFYEGKAILAKSIGVPQSEITFFNCTFLGNHILIFDT